MNKIFKKVFHAGIKSICDLSWKYSLIIYTSIIIILTISVIFIFTGENPPASSFAAAAFALLIYSLQLGLQIRYKSLRILIFYSLLPFIIVCAECINFNDFEKIFVLSKITAACKLSWLLMAIDISIRAGSSLVNLPKIGGIACGLFQSLIISIPIAVLGHNIFAGAPIEVDTIIAIYQTDLSEAIDFISKDFANIFSLLILFGATATLIYYNFKLTWENIPVNRYAGLTVSAIIFIVCSISANRMYWDGKLSFFRLLHCSQSYFSEVKKFNSRRFGNAGKIFSQRLNDKIKQTGFDGNFILIIGESTNKNYINSTNSPYLNSLKNDKNFFVFDNAYSCHTQTVQTLIMFLCHYNQYQNISPDENVTILDILKHCKYKINWLSNQNKSGWADSPISAIASSADYAVWLNKTNNSIVLKVEFDDKLIPEYEKIEPARRQFTILHLIGCHMPYKRRYPDGFAPELESDYARNIRKNDNTIEKLMSAIKKRNDLNSDVVIYVPDHSEIPEYGHESAKFQLGMTEIPMFVYLSPNYQSSHPEIVTALSKAKERIFTNDLVFNLILRLTGVDYKPAGAELDLLSEKYCITPENARLMHGAYTLDGKKIKKSK